MRKFPFAMRAGVAGMLALAALLAGCGSLSGSEMSRRTDADIEVARQRQADEKAELTSPGTYLSLIRRMQEQGMYYASLAHIDAYVQRFGRTPDVLLLYRRAARDRPAGGGRSGLPRGGRGHLGPGRGHAGCAAQRQCVARAGHHGRPPGPVRGSGAPPATGRPGQPDRCQHRERPRLRAHACRRGRAGARAADAGRAAGRGQPEDRRQPGDLAGRQRPQGGRGRADGARTPERGRAQGHRRGCRPRAQRLARPARGPRHGTAAGAARGGGQPGADAGGRCAAVFGAAGFQRGRLLDNLEAAQ